MSDEEYTSPEEELELDIVVTVQDGEVISVTWRGHETRALVRDYDVTFPCVAADLGMDEDGQYFRQLIV